MADEGNLIEKVGLGVDVIGGMETLTMVRQLRQEMQAIASLGGAIPSRLTSRAFVDPRQQTLNFEKEANKQLRLFDDTETQITNTAKKHQTQREKDFIASQKRMAAEKAKETQLSAPVTDKEVQEYSQRRARRNQIKQAADNLEARQEEAHQARLTAIQKRQEDRRKFLALDYDKEIERKRSRVTALNDPRSGYVQARRADVAQRIAGDRITEGYNARQSALFRQARRDPVAINDPLTNFYRTNYARQIVAQREQDRIIRREAEARNKALERDNEAHLQRQLGQYREHRTDLARTLASSSDPLQIANVRQRQLLRSARFDPAAINDPTTQQYRDEVALAQRAARIRRDTARQLERAREVESFIPTGPQLFQYYNPRANPVLNRSVSPFVKPSQAPVDPIFSLRGQALADYVNSGGRMKIGPPPPSGGGPPTPPIPPRPPRGLFNERGFFTSADAVGRITRNILLYEVISRATYGLAQYSQEALQAAKASVELTNALDFAGEQAGRTTAENEELVKSIKPLGLSTQEAQKAAIEANRFAETRPQDIDQLTKTVVDIAAARGVGVDKADELIEQLRRRESKFYKRVFGRTVESIYEESALQQIRDNPFQTEDVIRAKGNPLIKGQLIEAKGKNYLTTEDQVTKIVANMDDAQKEAAILNFILSQSGRFAGEAAERANTLAGKMDLVSSAFKNAKEQTGLFITDLQVVQDLFSSLAGSNSLIEKYSKVKLLDTGNYSADQRRYAQETVFGPRAQLLNTANTLFNADTIGGALGIGALAITGRRAANEAYRTQRYSQLVTDFTPQFGAKEAEKLALQEAGNAKAGLLRAVVSGMQMITVGMTTGILNVSSTVAGAAGATGLQQRLAGASQFITGTSRTIQPGTQFYGPAYPGPLGPNGRPIPNTLVYSGTATGFQQPNPKSSVQGEYSPFTPGRTPQDMERLQKYASTGGTIGGIGGLLIGAEVGSLVARTINAGPITATGLTILGSALGSGLGTTAGSAVGTAVGNAASGAVSGAFASLLSRLGLTSGLALAGRAGLIGLAAGTGLAIGSAVNRGVSSSVPFFGNATAEREGEAELLKQEALTGAWNKQVKEMNRNFSDGLIQFRNRTTGVAQSVEEYAKDPKKLTIDNYDIEVKKVTTFTGNYDEQGLPIFKDVTARSGRSPLEDAQLTEREQLEEDFRNAANRGQAVPEYRQQQQRELLAERQRLEREDALGYTKYLREARAQFEEEKLREREALQNRAERLLKYDYFTGRPQAQEDLLKVPQQVAESIVGPDNKFVKPLADQATLLERVTNQWGFLGQATVDYFAQLEQRSINLELIKLRFESLATAMDLMNKAERERDQYFGPGYSTRQNLIAGAYGVQAQGIQQEVQLRQLTRQLGPAFASAGSLRNQAQDTVFQINAYRDAFNRALRTGGNRQQLEDLYSRSIVDTAAGVDPRVFQTNIGRGVRQDVYRAIGLQRQAIARRTDEEFQKATLQAREDERLTRDLLTAQAKRDDLIKQGLPADQVGEALNRYVVGRTDNIPIKDLSLAQFQQRQTALQQLSITESQREAQATLALQKGVELQQNIALNVAAILEKLTGVKQESAKVLVHVQNTTQARVDYTGLQNSGTATGKDVPFDKGGYVYGQQVGPQAGFRLF